MATLAADHLVETDPDEPLYRLTRGQESELPQSAKLTFIDGDQAYRQAAAEARRTSSGSQRVSIADLPMVSRKVEATVARRRSDPSNTNRFGDGVIAQAGLRVPF